MNYIEKNHINGSNSLYDQVYMCYTDATYKVLCVWVDGVCVICMY